MLLAHLYRARLPTPGATLRISAFAASSRNYSVPIVTPKSKLWNSAEEAVKDVKSGDILLCGGLSVLCIELAQVTSLME
jgi:3-oxoacid CoA-transferase